MRKVGTLATMVLLTGCCLFKSTQAEPTASTTSLSSAQSANAKADSRLGAILAVTSENADNPETVKAELKIASAYLPLPTPGELNYVRQRVARNNPAEYEKAVKDAAKAKADLDALWGQMEVEQKKYEEQIKGLVAQSERQKKEIEQAKKDADRNLYGLAAVALLAIGGIAIALSRYMAGAGLMVAGVVTGAVPYLLDSPYFLVAVGGLFLVSIGFVLWHLLNPKPITTDVQTPKP